MKKLFWVLLVVVLIIFPSCRSVPMGRDKRIEGDIPKTGQAIYIRSVFSCETSDIIVWSTRDNEYDIKVLKSIGFHFSGLTPGNTRDKRNKFYLVESDRETRIHFRLLILE